MGAAFGRDEWGLHEDSIATSYIITAYIAVYMRVLSPLIPTSSALDLPSRLTIQPDVKMSTQEHPTSLENPLQYQSELPFRSKPMKLRKMQPRFPVSGFGPADCGAVATLTLVFAEIHRLHLCAMEIHCLRPHVLSQ